MKGKIICVKDELTGFDKPQIEVNENSAIRNFAYALSKNDYLRENAKNYSLYCIGEFDSDLGTIFYDDKTCYPKLLVHGSSLVATLENKDDQK